MRYLLICFENEKSWLELNDLSIAIRQVVLDEDSRVSISCREDCLAEGIIVPDDMEGICKDISKNKFQEVWESALMPYTVEWLKSKKKYHVGKLIKGVCKYFYPQGAVVKGEDYVAIYKGEKKLSVNELVEIQIIDYDEENLWLVSK